MNCPINTWRKLYPYTVSISMVMIWIWLSSGWCVWSCCAYDWTRIAPQEKVLESNLHLLWEGIICARDLTCISCLTRDKDYFAQRLREERSVMVKQSKEYWDSQAMLSMGIWKLQSLTNSIVVTLMFINSHHDGHQSWRFSGWLHLLIPGKHQPMKLIALI